MTFAVSDGAEIFYSYGYAAVNYLEIAYAYTETDIKFNDFGIVSKYSRESDRWDRQVAAWGWSTQEVGNLWPRWADARINVGGDTQKLINAWAQNHDMMKVDYAEARQNMFLETADINIPDLFGHAAARPFDPVPKDHSHNMLVNSSFAYIGLARRRTPMWWSTELAATTGSVECVETPSFVGSHSARMYVESGEEAYLRQYRLLPIEKNETLTASLWYMVPISAGTIDGVVAELQIWVVYADGTPGYASVPLEHGTDGEWVRAYISLALEKVVWTLTCRIRITNESSDSFCLYAGAAQMEASVYPSRWSLASINPIAGLVEVPISIPVDAYVDLGTESATETIVAGDPISYTSRIQRTLIPLMNYNDVWLTTWPTRATSLLTSTPPVAYSQTNFGWYALPERERFTTGWRIAGNMIQQYNAEIPKDVICNFDIGEMHLDEDQTTRIGIDREITRTLETLSIVDRQIWVLCTETLGGETHRVIKFLKPRSRWPIPLASQQGLSDLHLECVGDVDIGVSTGTADFMGVSEENPDELVVRIDDAYYVVSLEYDHYYIDGQTNQVVMRSIFDGELVTV